MAGRSGSSLPLGRQKEMPAGKRLREAEISDHTRKVKQLQLQHIEACLNRMQQNETRRVRLGSIDETRQTLGGAQTAATSDAMQIEHSGLGSTTSSAPLSFSMGAIVGKASLKKNKQKKKERRAKLTKRARGKL